MRHWTHYEKELVADMLRRKKTAGQIAPKFGRSRCAIIGLVNRTEALKAIGLGKRGRPPQRVRAVL